MPVKLERTDERLTRRTGLILVNRFGDKINLAQKIDRAFRQPGSNRGFEASHYVLTITEMLIDGATCLEDVRLFENDEAYKAMAEVRHYPTSDAIGDWLRRHGGGDGEERLWSVISSLMQTMAGGSGLTLDIDGTKANDEAAETVHTLEKATNRCLRYDWLHLPSRIVSHARYTIAKIAIAPLLFEHLLRIYLQLCNAPPPA